MSAWQLLVVYDLRYPDAWQLALEHGQMWGRLYADIHPLDSDHIAVVFRSGGERWRDWEELRLDWILEERAG